MEVFTVEVGRGSWPDSAGSGRISTPSWPTGWPSTTGWRPRPGPTPAAAGPSAARPVDPQVLVDNEASASSTVLEIRAPDEVGLLHRVTRTLFDCDLDVVSARVSTLGDEVVDAFYVRDAGGPEGDGRPGARPRWPSD